jgi:hypothetical protein
LLITIGPDSGNGVVSRAGHRPLPLQITRGAPASTCTTRRAWAKWMDASCRSAGAFSLARPTMLSTATARSGSGAAQSLLIAGRGKTLLRDPTDAAACAGRFRPHPRTRRHHRGRGTSEGQPSRLKDHSRLPRWRDRGLHMALASSTDRRRTSPAKSPETRIASSTGLRALPAEAGLPRRAGAASRPAVVGPSSAWAPSGTARPRR